MTIERHIPIENLSRRGFLQGAAGLTLGLAVPGIGHAAKTATTGAAAASFAPTPFLRIGADNSVTVISKHLEMGQGTYTGLATIVAEELDASWAQVKVEGAPADAKRYNNLFFGAAQGTGGSTAMANSWGQMRQTGATARAMLVSAAAKKWNVPAAEISVAEGVVRHAASGRKASFGELAEAAALEAVPAQVALKDPKDFRLIGKRAPRKDSAAKTDGSAQFTQDLHLPGMLVAVVAHPPRFGGKAKSVDASKTKAIKGVVDVVTVPAGVAVLARDALGHRHALLLGLVGQHGATHHIAHGPDARQVGLAVAIDHDGTALVELQADGFGIQTDGVGHATNRHNEFVSHQLHSFAFGVGVVDSDVFLAVDDLADFDAEFDLQTLLVKGLLGFFGDLLVHSAEESRQTFEDGHVSAETTPDRTHFQTNHA